jgi:multidrug efflux system membrane fusion protein
VEQGALAIPTKALLAGQAGNYVFVVGADKIAMVRQVSTGRTIGDLTTIDKGLDVGDQVVVDGQSRLTPNAKVDAKPASATTSAQGQAGGETVP